MRGKLSEAQRRFLAAIDANDGFLSIMRADMRSHSRLLLRGQIALTYSDGKGGTRAGYVLTPAGRRALAAGGGE